MFEKIVTACILLWFIGMPLTVIIAYADREEIEDEY